MQYYTFKWMFYTWDSATAGVTGTIILSVTLNIQLHV